MYIFDKSDGSLLVYSESYLSFVSSDACSHLSFEVKVVSTWYSPFHRVVRLSFLVEYTNWPVACRIA